MDILKTNPKPRKSSHMADYPAKRLNLGGDSLSEKTYSGLPRKEIQWHPTIDYKLCTGCGICVEFCHDHVFEKQGDKVVVARPYDCLVGCQSCKPRCPVSALTFPSREELKQTLRTLRKKYGYG